MLNSIAGEGKSKKEAKLSCSQRAIEAIGNGGKVETQDILNLSFFLHLGKFQT